MKDRYLALSMYLPLFLFFVTNLLATGIYPAKRCTTEMPELPIQAYPEEGFAAGTLVRVPDGYKPIENLNVHDTVLDDNLQPKKILKVAQRIANRCMRLTIGSQSICTGYDQCIRVTHSMQWQQVGTLDEQQCVLDVHGCMQSIDQHELVSEVTVLYQLVVEDHTFCIGPSEIVMHNADVAIVGAAMLFLEYFAYVHPVIALVEEVLALSTIALEAYEVYKQSHQHIDTHDDNDGTPQEIFLAERYYYEQHKQKLINLKNEFTTIYRGIIAIQELFYPHAITFSSQFLQNTLKHHMPSSLLKIAIADELKLSDTCKTRLRKTREQEFKLLEKEILELHAMLVVHFNELICRVHNAWEAYILYTATAQEGVALWNNNKEALTDQIASQSYEKEIIQECLLRDLQQKTTELKIVVAYYRQSKVLTPLQQSTNIIELVAWADQCINQIEQWIQKQLMYVHSIMSVSEKYFAKRCIPVSGFKNQVQSLFNKERANKNVQSLKKAQNTQANMCATGGPNDPKKPQDDDNKKGNDPRSQGKKLRHNSNPGQRGHHFRKGGGHIEEFTPEAEKILNKAFEEGTCHGVNKFGRWTYTWTNPADGNQIWIEVMSDGTVSNCGANVVHWTWNTVRGTLEKPAGFVQPIHGVVHK